MSITPEDVVKFMNRTAYGKDNPGPQDHPTCCRSSNLEFIKKAISYFMPNQHAWVIPANGIGGAGNPTKSQKVNKIIKDVKLAEVRQQGRTSNAKRDIKRHEYRKLVELLCESSVPGHKHFELASKMTAMLKMQFHIIGRTDDICNMKTSGLKSHEKFPDTALQMKVSWSKNVRDERQCPDQLLLGADDTDFCVLLALACFMESSLTDGSSQDFLFCNSIKRDYIVDSLEIKDVEVGPDRLNDQYRDNLSAIWNKNQDFIDLVRQIGGSLGTHSLCKFPSTYAAECGKTQKMIEIRGRWKTENGAIVNRYINVNQLPTDAEMAACLAVGGPVKYKVRAGSHITNHWMNEFVVPSISHFYSYDDSNHIADVLGPVLLWAVFQDDLKDLMSDTVRHRIRHAWQSIKGDHPDDYCPVEKRHLHVTRMDGQVFIDEMTDQMVQEEQQVGTAAVGDRRTGNNNIGIQSAANVQSMRDGIRSLQLQMNGLQNQLQTVSQQLQVSLCLFFDLSMVLLSKMLFPLHHRPL